MTTISKIINCLIALINFFSNNALYNHGEWAKIYVDNYFSCIDKLKTLKDQFANLKDQLAKINDQINSFAEAKELIAAQEAAYDRYIAGEICKHDYIVNWQNATIDKLDEIGYYDLTRKRRELENELEKVTAKLEDPDTKNDIWYWSKKLWFCIKWQAHQSEMAEEWKAINDQYRSQAEEALKRAEAAKDLEIAAETDETALDQYCMIVDDLEKIVKDLQEIESVDHQNKIHKDLRSKYGLDPMCFIK